MRAPVVLSRGMLTSLISPKAMKAECRMASLMLSSRPPMYSTFFGLLPLPAKFTLVDCIRYQRAPLRKLVAKSLLR